MKSKKKSPKTWAMNQYRQRGRSNRIRKVGGWAALVEKQLIESLSKSISKEIDKQILEQLKAIATNAQTNINS